MSRGPNATNHVLLFAAVAEATTGLALLIVPSLGGQVLLGAELRHRILVARAIGIALIGLGSAAGWVRRWPAC